MLQREADSSDPKVKKRDHIFSTIAVRLFFLLLFVADILWGIYACFLLVLTSVLSMITLFQIKPILDAFAKAYLSLKRALACGIALLIALFSPSFGIMVACTYFLMYDKEGIDEVVPSSLQSQIKEFFPTSGLPL
jgi:predicted PurR-regulated permease PerM